MSCGCGPFVPGGFVPGAGGGGGGGSTPSPYSPPEQWAFQNVPSGTIAEPMSCQVSTNFDTIKMIRAGRIVGLGTTLTEAIASGTLTVGITINGVPGTIVVVHTNASNQTGGQATQIAGDAYVAGDLIGMLFTTSEAFTPTTTDLEGWIEIVAEEP